ncbi:vacuole effluxer Atg22 like-domain-containing protein [Xylariaceae sp. FL0804]|nr:vacuole effluxer Atg22 like-domain-containing protein [Xylariaceae sp. FL0804]
MALYTYVYTQLLFSLPFSVFGTYTTLQLQTVGFAIGRDAGGGPCAADYSHKHILVTLSLAAYGIVYTPVFWLRESSTYEFQVLSGLIAVFNVVTNILAALLNIYIPYCMRTDTLSAETSSRHIRTVLRPFLDLLPRRSIAVLLVAFTIYNNTSLALLSVTSQIYVTEVRPGALEYSLYALAQTTSSVVAAVLFHLVRPRVPLRLETWLLLSYGLLLLVPVWGYIGLADINFGFKARWEFYIQAFLTFLLGVIANTSFRVLFSEMVPPCNEVRWCSLQSVLSSATIWVNYVASAPLQNATHQLRLPLVLSLVLLIVAFALELARNLSPSLRRDRERASASIHALEPK